MNLHKRMILVGVVFIAILSVLFFKVRSEYSDEIILTQKEIEGVESISAIHNLDILFKNLRGLTQLSKEEAKSLADTLFISENTISDAVEAVDDAEIKHSYIAKQSGRNQVQKVVT